MKIKKLSAILFTTVLLIILFDQFCLFSLAIEKDECSKIVLVIINRVDFSDLYNKPKIKEIIDNASIALMNTKASGGNSEYKSYATLGWGTRAEAAHNTSTFYNLNDDIIAIYKRRLGDIAEKEGVINININKLIQQNIQGDFSASPGILGDLLRQHDYKTAVIGNSDIEQEELRPHGFISMDSRGYIDYGTVENTLIKENRFSPFGIQTDYEYLLDSFINIYEKADFIVIDTGDTNRLDKYKQNLTEKTYQVHKNNVLENIDEFIANICNNIDFNRTILMIVTPYPSDYASSNGQRLTPVIIYNNYETGGILWSATTRRAGIVANIDIAPTILSYFKIEPQNMIGKTMKTVSTIDRINYINSLNEKVTNTSKQRYRVLYSFAVFQILVSIIAFLMIAFRKELQKSHMLFSTILLSTIVVPFVLLILPLFGMFKTFQIYFVLIVITLCIVFLLYSLTKANFLDMIMCTSLLTVLGLVIDTLTGQNLMKNSILGYDPIIGARYYGVGNEYMGVLIGSTLTFTTILIDRFDINRYIVFLFYAFIIITIAFPTLGANVGGTITAITAFSFASIKIAGRNINKNSLLIIFLSIIIIVACITYIDLNIINSQSHLAGMFQQVADRGFISIYQTITRKASMNIRIMGVTVWSKVLLTTIGILCALFWRPVGAIKKISLQYPNIVIGWSSIIVACVVSFLVNDSGVVAAATTIIYLNISILLMFINKIVTSY